MKNRDDILRILDELKSVVEHEQRLFGDILLSDGAKSPDKSGQHVSVPLAREPAVSYAAQTYTGVTVLKPVASAEPMLFDSSPDTKPTIAMEQWGNATSLDELNAQICTCTKCALGRTRTKFVFGVGNPKATLMLIGEAPGADEDAQGEPFVGRAGQLLNKILEAINFKRSDVYICNILKCRPPNNRKPAPEESDLCKPYLKKQIDLIKPKVILCLGLTAAENLLGTTESMGKLRGRVMQYEGVPVMVTYHPAALLRNPNWKRPAWEDVQALRKLHDELITKQ